MFNIFKRKKIEPAKSYDDVDLFSSKSAQMADEIVSDLVKRLIHLRANALEKHIYATHYYISDNEFQKLKARKFRGEPLFKDMCVGMKHIIREGPLEVTCINE